MVSDINKLPEEAPQVPLIPASIYIQTEKPKSGWWKWNIEFQEEEYRNSEVAPWEDQGRPRRSFETTMSCSDVFDPIPDLHRFLSEIKGGDPVLGWEVDEEGRYVIWRVWNLDAVTVCLHIFSEYRDEEFSWHFVLDRDSFIAELDAAYTSFGAQGGWGARWRNRAIGNGCYRKEIILDTGNSA